MSITVNTLKNALDKNDVESVRSIQVYCKTEIEKEIDKVDGNFKIARDPFAEMNFITDGIRSIILGDHEGHNKMVGAGRYENYTCFIFKRYKLLL